MIGALLSVMAGLVPAIGVLLRIDAKDVDARRAAGHDDVTYRQATLL
ncbi:hypothetical protein [Bradyrhizobium sp. NP1]|nr:hypothetical protein [Bradyrhizobium sp. NP1]WJR80600.1 hypothetical protein QOU61_12815 [Bradyrhizobium sp. NP1]